MEYNTTTSGYFDTCTAAIESYPDENLEIKIVIDDSDMAGSALNEHEIVTFNAVITNNDPATPQDVQLRINGLSEAAVRFTDNTDGSS